MARRKSIQLHLPATVSLGNCNKSPTDDNVTFLTSFRFPPRQVGGLGGWVISCPLPRHLSNAKLRQLVSVCTQLYLHSYSTSCRHNVFYMHWEKSYRNIGFKKANLWRFILFKELCRAGMTVIRFLIFFLILMKFFFCWCNALFLPVHSHLSVSVCAQVIEQHLWNDTERMESEWKGSDGNCNNRSNIIWLNCQKKRDWERDGDIRVERERESLGLMCQMIFCDINSMAICSPPQICQTHMNAMCSLGLKDVKC